MGIISLRHIERSFYYGAKLIVNGKLDGFSFAFNKFVFHIPPLFDLDHFVW